MQALTHSSYANEHKGCADYERLEFLGDAVLEMISSACLFAKYPEKKEGELTRLRAALVCEPALAFCMRHLRLEDFVMLGKGEEDTGGRKKDSILSDVMEALIGAMYLDAEGDLVPVRAFVERTALSDERIENAVRESILFDSKTRLQEEAALQGLSVRYELVGETGPAHDRTFESAVYVGEEVFGRGAGRSKKVSEQAAAVEALKKLQQQE